MSDEDSLSRRKALRYTGVAAVGSVAAAGLLNDRGAGRRQARLSDAGRESLTAGRSAADVEPVAARLNDRGYELALSRGQSNTVEVDGDAVTVAVAPFEGTGTFAETDSRSDPYLITVRADGTQFARVVRLAYDGEQGRLRARAFDLADGTLERSVLDTVSLDEELAAQVDSRVESSEPRVASNGDEETTSTAANGGTTDESTTDDGGITDGPPDDTTEGIDTGVPDDCPSGLDGDIGCLSPHNYCCDIHWGCAGQIVAIVGCTVDWRACPGTAPVIGNFIENGVCHWCECCAPLYNCPE